MYNIIHPNILASIAFFAPLASFVILIFLRNFIPRKIGCVISTALLGAAAISASILFVQHFVHGQFSASSILHGISGENLDQNGIQNAYAKTSTGIIDILLFTIIKSSSLSGAARIYLDSLGVIMLTLILLVSFFVHMYSTEYMEDDSGQARFMALLSFFTFCMIFLITARDLLQIFFGWELVGVSSYLLIGFWFNKESANLASIKAFVVNRVADFGLIIGICILFTVFDSIDFIDILNPKIMQDTLKSSGAGNINLISLDDSGHLSALYIAMLCILFGCMGKSAQIGLHIWLPDAMEGPTPVSALIHAATMVTAGVFLIARLSPLFDIFSSLKSIILIIGGLTAFLGATLALIEYDIKRIIAYSTCSQLGYMFMSCGAGAYDAAIFHLFTHAFFKANLFLSAGSVIHGTNNEQDIRRMGGLRKYMPITFFAMGLSSLALVGIFPFSGYFSKDAILNNIYLAGQNKYIYYLGLLCAIFTGIYSTKIMIFAFFGKTADDCANDVTDANDRCLKNGGAKNKNDKEMNIGKPHDPHKRMMLPMLLLLIPTILAGIYGVQIGFINHESKSFWSDSIIVHHDFNLEVLPALVHYAPLMCGFCGILLAIFLYRKRFLNKSLSNCTEYMTQESCSKCPMSRSIGAILINKYYFDNLYSASRIISALCGKRLSSIDDRVIDRGTTLAPKIVDLLSSAIDKISPKTFSAKIKATILAIIIFTILGMNLDL